ncbi:MAG: hypothetical protein AAFU53_00955 [Cyanobacteria bacterium J06632_3]
MKYQIFAYSLLYSAIATLFWTTSTYAQIGQMSDGQMSGEISPQENAPVDSLPEDEGDEASPLNLSPESIEQSPVLQRWLEDVPNVRDAIRYDPSFKTRVQLGYSYFPSSGETSGIAIGVEDIFLGRTPLTVSADYQDNFESGDDARTAYGANLHYYVLPLGSYFNVSPILGYRHADSGNDYSVDGANVGVRLRFVPSRTGAADITLDQSWIVGDSEGLSVTHINLGYAVTSNLRFSTDLEWQSTADEGDSRVGLNLEWML